MRMEAEKEAKKETKVVTQEAKAGVQTVMTAVVSVKIKEEAEEIAI